VAIGLATEEVLSEGRIRSRDFGGHSSTVEVGEAIVNKLERSLNK